LNNAAFGRAYDKESILWISISGQKLFGHLFI
jgi:hypothetical protein